MPSGVNSPNAPTLPDKIGWDRQFAANCSALAQISYGSDGIPFGRYVATSVAELGYYGAKAFGVQAAEALVCESEDHYAVAVRGTDSMADFATDARILRVAGPFIDPHRNNGCQVHRGFLNHLDLIWGQLHEHLQPRVSRNGKRVIFVGHSLGAAVATLAALRWLESCATEGRPSSLHSVWAFGSPRIGNGHFRTIAWHLLAGRLFRLVCASDLVPAIPPWTAGYRHTRGFYYCTRGGNWIKNPNLIAYYWDRWASSGFRPLKRLRAGVADHAVSQYVEALK